MRRLANLITEDTITIDLCKTVIHNASYRKGTRQTVMKVLDNIDEYAKQLRDMVLNDTYTPAKYTYETKMEHGKERKLTKVRFFPDQCIHHLLIILIRDTLMKRIDPYAIASVPGRGQGLGVKKLKYWIQEQPDAEKKTKYCGKGDIKKCFENIKPDVVMKMYSDMIKDKKYLNLMGKVMYSCPSLPLGNYCSAWTLNILLKDMDERIRQQPGVNHYLRYMDDFVFFCERKEDAHKVWVVVREELAKLKLELKANYQVFSLDDRSLDMIGYRFSRNNVILRKRNFKKILRQLQRLSHLKFYKVRDCQSIVSRLGQCRHCNSSYIWKLVNKYINLHKMLQIISEDSKVQTAKREGYYYSPKIILL